MSRAAKPEGLIRYLWPSLASCPVCAETTPRKVSRNGRRQTMECRKCGHAWALVARYAEIDQGGGFSEIRPV